MRLKNKKIIVTAAAQGIGRATAIAFANEGADVIATDINQEKLTDLATINPKIKTQFLDSTNKKDVEAFGIEKFVNLCKERVLKYSKIQTEQSVRLGYWMDWENSYFTMSNENNYTIWRFLKKM